MKKRNFFLEALLIVFSVLLAFFLNELRINYKEAKQTDIMLLNLESEIERNSEIVNRIYEYHTQVKDNLENAYKSDTLLQAFTREGSFTTFKMSPKGVIQEIIPDIAWDIAKENNISSKVDFETAVALFNVYNQQNTVMSTINELLGIYGQRESRELSQIETTAQLIYRSYNEVCGQERSLLYLYDEALKQLEQEN